MHITRNLRTDKSLFVIALFVTFELNVNGIFAYTQELLSCCSEASGSCRSTCEKISLVEISADNSARETVLYGVRKFCTPELIPFWTCFNETLQAVIRGTHWSGRSCCTLARSPICRHSCVTASSNVDIISKCRQSDEQHLFACIERQTRGEQCCGNARTSDCHEACRALFRGRATPSREARAHMMSSCAENSPRVQNCARNQTRLTPPDDLLKYLPCCMQSQQQECRESCRRALRNAKSQQEAVDYIIDGGCGPPLPQVPIWKCFLSFDQSYQRQFSKTVTDRVRVLDSAKLHCCNLAREPRCRRLCLQTFGNDWTEGWEQLDTVCLSQSSEDVLRRCVDEVEEPCELGCDGLSFCSNFNNRPTDLFRSCNQNADEAARQDVELWHEQGFIALPGFSLPLKDITKCSPDIWRAVACALQLKPCTRKKHIDRICRQDCLDLLTRCADWNKAPIGLSAEELCSDLSPDNPEDPCVSLQPYLEPSSTNVTSNLDLRKLVTSPCRGISPCRNHNDVCMVNRCPGANCPSTICLSGCPLGEASKYIVPQGILVRVPMDNEINGQQKGCLKICKCGEAGLLTDCQPLPCVALDSCSLAGRKIEHSSWFYVECNLCSCYAGEIVCGKRKCSRRGDNEIASRFGTLPCDCPAHYVPVCGSDGNTYGNPCLAKCSGISDVDIEFGPCMSRDPCLDHQCRSNQVCIPKRTVCLSLIHRPCLQYECVNKTCVSSTMQPVCSSTGLQYSSACELLSSGTRLAYWGQCLTGCSSKIEAVCGINGVTYDSECAAWADYSSVDYIGQCSAVGLIADSLTLNSAQCGSEIKCKPLQQIDCEGYIPPGACCPVCAGAIRIIYSRKQIDRALYALRGPAQSHLTLAALLRALERQIQVAQCSIRGYLSPESDLFVLVQSNEPNPSSLQLDTCVREAEKLAGLIRNRSPRIASELSLSSLTAAKEVHRNMSDNAPNTIKVCYILVLGLLAMLLIVR